jgi:hypothetical protein
MGLNTARTEFELVLDAIVPQVDRGQGDCNRFGRFDCSNDVWKIPPDLVPVASGTHRAAAPPAASTTALLALAVAWLSARLTRHRSS